MSIVEPIDGPNDKLNGGAKGGLYAFLRRTAAKAYKQDVTVRKVAKLSRYLMAKYTLNSIC